MVDKKENKAVTAKARTIRTSPRKLNLVAETIRGLAVGKALNELAFSSRRVAGDVRKTLMAAIANAENNHNLDVDRLYVAEAYVGKALVMKRFRPMAKGRAGKILKPFSNLTIVVKEQDKEAQAKEKPAKPAKPAKAAKPAAATKQPKSVKKESKEKV